MNFPQRLKQKRERREWNQKELAAKLNVDNESISRWENGRCMPTLKNLIGLCTVFECSISELLGR